MSDATDDQIPSPRADTVIFREKTGIHIKATGPGVSAELDVTTDGSAQAPTVTAINMLLLVTAACLAAVTVAVICKLAAAAAVLLVIAALTTFAGVLITGLIISLRRNGATRTRQELTPSHLTPNEIPREVKGNGTARALSREAHQNGHRAGKEHKGRKGQPGKPSRR
jgi:hypothetical protein